MYEDYFGLSASPFQLNPDPQFFFWSKGHRRAYKNLKSGLSQDGGFVVVTGEVGAGKTTLARLLLGELDPHRVLAVQLVSTQLDADDLVRAVAYAFGLSITSKDKAQLTAEIEEFLIELGREAKRALLVVDEAQNLSAEALNELLQLSNIVLRHDASLLQCVLVGQPEFRTRLEDRSMQKLRQRVIASYHLGKLEEAEMSAYVEHRLTHVGWKHDPAFEPQVFPFIFEATMGIPRRINSLCNRLLLGAYLEQEHRIGLHNVEQTAAELRDELGTDALPAVKREPEFKPVAPGGAGMGNLMVSSITARLDRLEQSIAHMLERIRAVSGQVVAKSDARREQAPRPSSSGAFGPR